MAGDLEKQEENKPKRDSKGRLLPGYTANPNGRPKGSTLKEFTAFKFRSMTDEEKEKWLKDNGVSAELMWRMAEGNPPQTTELKADIELSKVISVDE